MSCERFREAIAGHAAGADLEPAAAAHLAGCEACATRLALQRRLLTEVDAELERALAVTASPELVTRVTARVAASDTGPATWRPAVAWMGLAAAAALAAGVYLRAPATTAPAGPTASASTATAHAPAPVVTSRSLPQPPAPSIAGRGIRRSTPAARRQVVAAAPVEEPPVIVDPAQLRAIARLQELLIEGRLNEKVLPPAHPHEATELAIAPLEIPDITVPDVEAVGRAPGTGNEQQ